MQPVKLGLILLAIVAMAYASAIDGETVERIKRAAAATATTLKPCSLAQSEMTAALRCCGKLISDCKQLFNATSAKNCSSTLKSADQNDKMCKAFGLHTMMDKKNDSALPSDGEIMKAIGKSAWDGTALVLDQMKIDFNSTFGMKGGIPKQWTSALIGDGADVKGILSDCIDLASTPPEKLAKLTVVGAAKDSVKNPSTVCSTVPLLFMQCIRWKEMTTCPSCLMDESNTKCPVNIDRCNPFTLMTNWYPTSLAAGKIASAAREQMARRNSHDIKG